MVSVGDYVWLDADHDGIQGGPNDQPLQGIGLSIEDPQGNPVTDVYGVPVPTVYTDQNGYYVFENLPALPAGQHYTVVLDPSTVPTGLAPTKENQGTDTAVDSSTGSADSGDLVNDGDSDMTLDFGFWAPSPAIQIVKMDAKGNDANTPATAAQLTTNTTKLVFKVTNLGDEALTNIVISDQVIKGGKVTNMTCTFPDGTTGLKWAGPFEIGDTFKCTATLTTPNGKHKDVADVTATGQESGTHVNDNDPYHAVIDVAVLPQAGTTITPWTLAGITTLILTGLALITTNKRRRRHTH